METGKYATFRQTQNFIFLYFPFISALSIHNQKSAEIIVVNTAFQYFLFVTGTLLRYLCLLLPGGLICNHLRCPFHNKSFLGETNTHEVSASTDCLYLIADNDNYYF
jgi:hypothetical protein